MKIPLISAPQRDRQQFQEVNKLLQRIFNPEDFSVRQGVQQVIMFGGITSVLSLLQISHRQGLSSHADYVRRIKVFGRNVSPKGQNIIKKSISAQRDFTINLLFYIITLSFFIKLLFVRDGIEVQNMWDEIVSFILLLVMILLKAMVNLQFLKMDQLLKKYQDQEWVKVRRDGQVMETKQKFILVGDIILVEADDTVRIDGILLAAVDLSVNQSQTILKQDSKRKYSILNLKENENNYQFDPFILAGSTIIYGKGQILVCRVGQQCSFRVNNQKFEQFSAETTPLIYNLKKVLTYVQKSSNTMALITSTYFAFYSFHEAMKMNSLNWFTFLYILKTYSSFIGFVCLLQKLKIMRSLQFYLQSYRSDKYFRIKNKCTLQKLNQVDLFIVDKEALKVLETDREIVIPKLEFLSYLNRHFKLKIVTDQKQQKIMDEFDLFDSNGTPLISKNSFFVQKSDQTTQQRIKRLKESFYITECNRKKLETDLIPIFQGMEYKIAYIYRFKPNQENNRTSSNIISICFSEEYSEVPNRNQEGSLEEWVRIKNTSIMEDHVKYIMERSIIFCQLYNVYMVQFVNNIIIFFFLSWVSIHRSYSIDFYWSLIIIIIARYIFFRIYRTITLGRDSPRYEMISHRRIIKLNMFLFFYYLYVIVNLQQKINVVLFFVFNAMLRTQILLFRIHRSSSIRNMVKYNLIVFTFLAGYILVKIINIKSVREQVMLLQYTMGLSMLLVMYGFML